MLISVLSAKKIKQGFYFGCNFCKFKQSKSHEFKKLENNVTLPEY